MSKENVIHGIDYMINILKDLKETITDENCHKIELKANTKIDRESEWDPFHPEPNFSIIVGKTLEFSITDRRRC